MASPVRSYSRSTLALSFVAEEDPAFHTGNINEDRAAVVPAKGECLGLAALIARHVNDVVGTPVAGKIDYSQETRGIGGYAAQTATVEIQVLHMLSDFGR